MEQYKQNRFSVYDSQEETVLELVEGLCEYTNGIHDKVDTKTDLLGDHKGSWQGITDVALADPGIAGSVIDLREKYNNITNYSISLAQGKTDTEKINDMINKHNIVYLPQGIYHIDGDGILLKSDTQIYGDENNKTILRYSGNNACFYHNAPKDQWGWDISCTNTVLRNLNIEVLNNNSDGIRLDRVMRCRFDNIKVKGGRHGILHQSGWTNHFERLELIENGIGIKIGDNSYATTQFQSLINNAINIVNSRIEYNRKNIQLGDSEFDGSQQGSNINILNNTIQFANECELEVISFDTVNIENNYFESLNVNEECLIKVGYTNKTPNPDPFNSFLLCSNINVKGNLLCVDKGQGRIVGIKAKNHRNMIIENNTFFGFFITDHTSGKVMVMNETNESPLDYQNNTNIGSPFNVQGNINIKTLHEFSSFTFKNGWFNGGTHISENLKVVKTDNVINIRGVIATDGFIDGDIIDIPTSIKIYDDVNMVVKSTKFDGYVDDFFKLKVTRDNKLKVTSYGNVSGKVVIYLNLSFIM